MKKTILGIVSLFLAFGFVPYVNAEELASDVHIEIIESNTIEASTKEEINEIIQNKKDEFEPLTKDNVEYNVLTNPIVDNTTYDSETKEEEFVGTFDTEEEAIEKVIELEDSSTETLIVDANYIERNITVVDDEVTLDEIFATKLGAEAYLLTYRLRGYDVTGCTIETITVTESFTEEKTFTSIEEYFAYKKFYEALGNNVKIRIKDIDVKFVESDVTEIDVELDSIKEIASYLINLAKSYNKLLIKFDNNSYVAIKYSSVSEVFNSEEEAYDYLKSLKKDYNVSDFTIEKNENTVIETPVEEYFDNETSANEYLESLVSTDTTVENAEVIKLTGSEIDVEKVKDSLVLDDETIDYLYLTPDVLNLSTNVNIVKNGVYSTVKGTYIINKILINGEEYEFSVLNRIPVNSNSVVEISGKLTYCSSGRICLKPEVVEFENSGIMVSYNNTSALNQFFTYKIFAITVNDNEVVVEDNLIPVYKASGVKTTTYNDPMWTLKANVNKTERVFKVRIYGTVSNVSILVPVTVEATISRDVEKQNLTGIAVKSHEETVYDVYSKETIITEEPSFSQYYEVVKTTYLSNEEGIGDVEEPIIDEPVIEEPIIEDIPTTGINEIDYKSILAVIAVAFASLEVAYYSTKRFN